MKKNEDYSREKEVDDLWKEYHILMKKINIFTYKLHKDYPELTGEDQNKISKI